MKKLRDTHYKLYRDVFMGFFRATIFGYGGGPSTIPLVYKEVVEKYKWMTEEEFSDVLALGNSLPGPISTKMAGYIGYKIAGFIGLIIAIIATVVPTIILMVLLMEMIYIFNDSLIVKKMIQAVSPIVCVMLLKLGYSFFKHAKISLGWRVTTVLAIVSLVAYQLFHIHPAFLVGALILSGLLLPKRFLNRSSSITKEKTNG